MVLFLGLYMIRLSETLLRTMAKSRGIKFLREVSAFPLVVGRYHIPRDDFARMLGRPAKKKRSGLGDLTERIIRPFAKFSDKHFGTSLVSCSACKQRKATLNRFSDWVRTLFH